MAPLLKLKGIDGSPCWVDPLCVIMVAKGVIGGHGGIGKTCTMIATNVPGAALNVEGKPEEVAAAIDKAREASDYVTSTLSSALPSIDI